MKEFIKNITGAKKVANYLREEIDKMKILSARVLVNKIKQSNVPVDNIHDTEFCVFSQWGDDGIIQYLIHLLDIKNETFIEFGVGNYMEANTRFLLVNNNWKGLIFDGSEKNMAYVQQDSISWKFDITAKSLFVTKDNINNAIKGAGFEGEIGILHIDIDGNDYWIWENIDVVNPEIVIMEYNSVFGNKAAISVPYSADFFVTNAHHSNLFFGASLKAMCFLAEKKGYSFVGSNSNGNNAYFVRNDKLKNIKTLSADEGYVACRFRQNRDVSGNLTFKSDMEMIHQCDQMLVVDVTTNTQAPLKNYL